MKGLPFANTCVNLATPPPVMLASPFEPQSSFDTSSSRDSWRDSWRSSLSSVHQQLGELDCSDMLHSTTTGKRRSRLMPAMRVQPLRVSKARTTANSNNSHINASKTPAAHPVSAWSDSDDDSDSDYEANSICDSDTDVEGCQCLPKYAGLSVADSPKSQSSEFTVQGLKPAKPAAQNAIAATKRNPPRGNLKTPMLSPSETVMERYAPLEWSDAARDALKIALERRQRAMDDAGVSHFIQIEALHNCLKDVAFGVSLRETV